MCRPMMSQLPRPCLGMEQRPVARPGRRRNAGGSVQDDTEQPGSEQLQQMVTGELSQFAVLHLRHYYSSQMIAATGAHVFVLKQQFNKGFPLTVLPLGEAKTRTKS